MCVANLSGAQGSRVQTTRPSTEFAQTNSVFPTTTRTHNPRGYDTYSVQTLYVRTSPMPYTEHGGPQQPRIRSVVTVPSQSVRAPFREEGGAASTDPSRGSAPDPGDGSRHSRRQNSTQCRNTPTLSNPLACHEARDRQLRREAVFPLASRRSLEQPPARENSFLARRARASLGPLSGASPVSSTAPAAAQLTSTMLLPKQHRTEESATDPRVASPP